MGEGVRDQELSSRESTTYIISIKILPHFEMTN